MKQKRLELTIEGVEGVRLIIENDEDGDVLVRFDYGTCVTDCLRQYDVSDQEAIRALGFPTKEEPVEVAFGVATQEESNG